MDALYHLTDVQVTGMASMAFPGLFNDAIAVTTADGQEWVVRISPDPTSVPFLWFEHGMLAREAALGELLADHDYFPPVLHFDGGDLLEGREVLIREAVRGTNGQAAIDADRYLEPALWNELLSFDARLPAIPTRAVGFPGAWSDSWSQVIANMVAGLRDDLRRYGIRDRYGANLERIVQSAGCLLDSRPMRLCHGDLWPKNVIVSDATACRGTLATTILDWERAFVGDPLSQWLHQDEHGFTMFSSDLSRNRPAAPYLDGDASLLASLYTGIVGLLMLAETVRNPVDPAAAEKLLQGSHSVLREH
jgi:aminoglycoside phosphotransferase (APT) family kinase protein